MQNDTPEYEQRVERRQRLYRRGIYGAIATVGLLLGGGLIGKAVKNMGPDTGNGPTPDLVKPPAVPPKPLGFDGCSVQKTGDVLAFQFPKEMAPGSIRLSIGTAGQTPTPMPPTGMSGGVFRYTLPDSIKGQEIRVIMQFNDGTGWKQGTKVVIAK
ncbi:MAG: hypothetical protein G01um101425_847 [Candidatus Peregrinibacteria bacterium Gr01-1014_25]|nr:MAG: hypothetical protein G01um101425_847 [Candidatus Peregrinibacteria bacterium Gr01-1014_25]